MSDWGVATGHFAGQSPWAHIDIAGLAFDGQESGLGATGYGVAMLVVPPVVRVDD